jgi:ribosomal-protein-alanine N-acetyltransferase
VAEIYPVLATEHLRLRGFVEGDSARVSGLSDSGNIDTAPYLPQPLLRFPAERWIATHELLWETLQALHWAITALSNDALLGYAGLRAIDLENRRGKLGFRVAPLGRNDQIAIEAAQAVLAFGFTELGMHRISACHRERQPLAAQALASLGMRREGLLRQHLWNGEQFEDVVLCAILRSEWMALIRGPGVRSTVIAPRDPDSTTPVHTLTQR